MTIEDQQRWFQRAHELLSVILGNDDSKDPMYLHIVMEALDEAWREGYNERSKGGIRLTSP